MAAENDKHDQTSGRTPSPRDTGTSWTIRPVGASDVKELQDLSRETFRVTFAPMTPPDDLAVFLRDNYATDKLLREIANPDSRFFFLVVDGQTAGYTKLNIGQAQTERLRPNALEVERIYLRTQFQHRGLGHVLLRYAEEIARAEKRDWMWLGVYEHNLVAQRFYARNGFTRVGQHDYPVGGDPQIDFLLVKRLTY